MGVAWIVIGCHQCQKWIATPVRGVAFELYTPEMAVTPVGGVRPADTQKWKIRSSGVPVSKNLTPLVCKSDTLFRALQAQIIEFSR